MVTRSDIVHVYDLIRPYIRRTPVIEVEAADFGLSHFSLALKLEGLQRAGSFKTRGAFANLLTRSVPPSGVVAASGGNHGVAVAYAANQLRRPAKIFVPSVSSGAKVARIRALGADLEIVGESYADALRASEQWASHSGALPVHAFDDTETLLGQGTLALELDGQAADIDTLLVPVGGGGLIGGIAAWYAGAVRVIGVEPKNAPTLSLALAAGCPVDAPASGIAADSLAPARVGRLMFPIAQEYVDAVVLVSDEDILLAQQALWHQLRLAAEPGGASAFAGLISGAYIPTPGEKAGVVISGANREFG